MNLDFYVAISILDLYPVKTHEEEWSRGPQNNNRDNLGSKAVIVVGICSTALASWLGFNGFKQHPWIVSASSKAEVPP